MMMITTDPKYNDPFIPVHKAETFIYLDWRLGGSSVSDASKNVINALLLRRKSNPATPQLLLYYGYYTLAQYTPTSPSKYQLSFSYPSSAILSHLVPLSPAGCFSLSSLIQKPISLAARRTDSLSSPFM
jgi:hypothetical protein